MASSSTFRERIDNSSKKKKSHIILALDSRPRPNLKEFVKTTIALLEQHICAIKINFHLILPLSNFDILEINELAHSYGLQSIADIKLNDVASTNKVAIGYLLKMGFDAVIVNPFIGKSALKAAVEQAHESDCGVIALIYMSHRGAKEGYGINTINNYNNNSKKNSKITAMYELFLHYAYKCEVDGIIVGATHIDILKEISRQKKVPIYSPGFGAQGGDIKLAGSLGTDYFIIGRSIIAFKDPLKMVKEIQRQISHI